MAKVAADAFEKLLATASKKYDLTVGAIDEMVTDTEFLTTGNLAIDYAMGGGVPLGRSIEFLGVASSGKTTSALQTAIALQRVIIAGGDETRGIKANDVIMYLDYEQAMDIEYARALGLVTDHPSFMFTQPDTLEQGADFLLSALKTGRVRLAIIDSVAAMNPSAQAEADSVGKSLPAIQAKLMKPFGVTLNSVLKHANASVIFINHEMEKMEMGTARRPGMPAAITTPGGAALKYFASVRVQFRQIKQNKGKIINPLTNLEQEIPLSTDVRIKILKNKVAPPFREAIVRVRFGSGFDQFWTALQILLSNKKIIHQAGRYYFHNLAEIGGAPEWMSREKQGTNRPYIHGEARIFSRGDSDTEWRDILIEEAARIARENRDALKGVVGISPIAVEDEDDEEEDSVELDLPAPKSKGRRVEI